MGSADGLLAQSVEQRTFNPLVAGSNPAQPTTSARGRAQGLLAQLVEQRTLNPLVASSNLAGPTKTPSRHLVRRVPVSFLRCSFSQHFGFRPLCELDLDLLRSRGQRALGEKPSSLARIRPPCGAMDSDRQGSFKVAQCKPPPYQFKPIASMNTIRLPGKAAANSFSTRACRSGGVPWGR